MADANPAPLRKIVGEEVGRALRLVPAMVLLATVLTWLHSMEMTMLGVAVAPLGFVALAVVVKTAVRLATGTRVSVFGSTASAVVAAFLLAEVALAFLS